MIPAKAFSEGFWVVAKIQYIHNQDIQNVRNSEVSALLEE
jgi:hypothetical protein